MTWERCTDPEPPEVLVGTPIDDTVVVLLDERLRPVPIGVPAEICFGGAIAAGYQARDDLTAAKFVATPVPLEEALRADGRCPPCPVLYRSGDLAMRLPSGNLRFLGRVDRQVRGASHFLPLPEDEARVRLAHRPAFAPPHNRLHQLLPLRTSLTLGYKHPLRTPSLSPSSCVCVRVQVKVRGFRIELEAVEAVARSHWEEVGGRPAARTTKAPPPVQLAAVASSAGELLLFVSKEAAAMSRGGSILEHCAQALPTYSVPRRVIALAAFPTLPNGKINLTALAAAGGDALPGAQTIETAKTGSGGGKGADGRGAAKRFATDSLGMVREVNAGAAASLAREMAVADTVRAFLMYGVVMDHFAGCADGSTVRECAHGSFYFLAWLLLAPSRVALALSALLILLTLDAPACSSSL